MEEVKNSGLVIFAFTTPYPPLKPLKISDVFRSVSVTDHVISNGLLYIFGLNNIYLLLQLGLHIGGLLPVQYVLQYGVSSTI